MPPPNVLLLVADDLPRGILGAYGARHGLLTEIDGLAKHGLVFSSAYTVAPLCTPSRYSLLTGTYASRGARERSDGGSPFPARQVDFQVFLNHHSRSPPTPTLARLLSGAGFTTGLLGKYHVGHSLQASDCGGATDSHRSNAPFVRASLLADASGRADQSCQTIGNQSCIAASIRRHAGFDYVADVYYDNDALTFYAHEPEWMAHEAVRFVRGARRRHKPFFLWMAPSLTHSPADVTRQLTSEPRYGPAGCGGDDPAGDGSAFKAAARRLRAAVLARLSGAKLLCRRNATDWRICSDERLPSPSSLLQPEPWIPARWFLDEGNTGAGRRAALATSVALATWLDASLAPLFVEVAQGTNGSAATEQTITIFTADHGPYFAGKGHAYEAGARVPLLVNWLNGPAAVRGGHTVATRVTHLDVLPTLAAIVAAATPQSVTKQAAGDGQVIQALLGAGGALTNPPPAPPLFIEVGFSRTVVVDGYKLMVHMLPPAAAADSLCRSIHGIKLPSVANQSAEGGGAAGAKLAKIKFLYDVRERHPLHHCDRVQLYDLTADPAEQVNLAASQPERVSLLRTFIDSHVTAVEAASGGAHTGATGKASSPSISSSTSSSSSMGSGSRTLRGSPPSTADGPLVPQQRSSVPRSWCQTCHPSTECARWPNEWNVDDSSTVPKLDDGVRDLIRQHADSLVAAMRANASARGVAAMVGMARGEPYAPREKCVLLRVVGGRVLIDFLGTDYAQQKDFDIASCYPSRKGNFLRSRLHVGLRLLLRVLRQLRSLPDFEIGICPDDCSPALSSSDQGVLPALTSVSCAGRRTLPFVAWTVNSNRATDLSEWDTFIEDWARKAKTVAWRERAAKAVFRGHLRSFTVCGNWPDAGSPQYNEPVGPDNWRTRGRQAIWAARMSHPELLDVNFDNRAEMAKLLKMSDAEARQVDDPPSISMEEQARRFRYVIHPEGQCGFADRLKSIMALPMLVLKQANPCAEWYEGLLVAGEHYVPVDGSYSNLSQAVAWARAHDDEAQRMVDAGHTRIRQVVSVPGIYAYVERLVESYAKRYAAESSGLASVGSYTHEFACSEVGQHTRCRMSRLL
jgi:arylsulfatase A-like enzyme